MFRPSLFNSVIRHEKQTFWKCSCPAIIKQLTAAQSVSIHSWMRWCIPDVTQPSESIQSLVSQWLCLGLLFFHVLQVTVHVLVVYIVQLCSIRPHVFDTVRRTCKYYEHLLSHICFHPNTRAVTDSITQIGTHNSTDCVLSYMKKCLEYLHLKLITCVKFHISLFRGVLQGMHMLSA